MRLSVCVRRLRRTWPTPLPIVRRRRRKHGLDGVWTAEHLGFHDAVVPSAMYLARDRAHRDRARRVQHREPPSRPSPRWSSCRCPSSRPGRVRVQVGRSATTALVAKLGRTIPKPIASTTGVREQPARDDGRAAT